jgi:small subunit ribosomal protein S13
MTQIKVLKIIYTFMAVRIAGVTIPNDKRIEIALTYIFGIGPATAVKILKDSKISSDIRVKDLSEDEVNRLRVLIEKNYRIEGDLKRDISSNIKRLKEISAYRGIRHSKNLPVRGQRTKTNSRTVRGNVRKTSGSGRKISAQKT